MTAAELRQLADDEAARQFARDLIARAKMLNRDAGINLAQALWTHHRTRAMEVTISEGLAAAIPSLASAVGIPMQIDLLNLVISGDLETAYAALAACTPDDGTQPYHFWTSDAVNWFKHEIGVYLGWE